MNSQTLHTKAFVADLHCDTILQMRRGYDISQRHDTYHVDIPRLRQGGVDLQVFATSINPHDPVTNPFKAIDQQLDFLHQEIDKRPNDLVICRSASDAVDAKVQGKIGVILAIEGGNALESNPGNLEHFHGKGVRLITIAHEKPTGWCAGWSEKNPAIDGLTEAGRGIITEMDRLGIIIDLSHSATSTVDAVFELTDNPVIASHSCAYSLCKHDRNVADHHLKKLADRGGVIGVTFVDMFLSIEFHQISSEFWERHPQELKRLMGLFLGDMDEDRKSEEYGLYQPILSQFEQYVADVRPTVATVVDHIGYLVNQIGVDHVGIGSDYDGMSLPPLGLEDCSKMPNITKELVERGYSETDIGKILGENFLRVFNRVCQ